MFPLTYAQPHETLPHIEEVRQQVFKLRQSPYAAWLNALEIDKKQLPEFLGVSEEAALYYRKHGDLSPHPDNVRKFCDTLGIHPAYLLPVFLEFDPSRYSHPSILSVICDVLDDPNASDDDRDLSILALQAESLKFDRFLKSNAHTKLGRLIHSALQSYIDAPDDKPKGLSAQFTQMSAPQTLEAEFLIEHFRAFLHHELAVFQAKENYKARHVKYLQQTLNGLNEFARDPQGARLELFVRGVERQARKGEPWPPETVAARYYRTFPVSIEDRNEFTYAERRKVAMLLPLYVDERRKQRILTQACTTLRRDIENLETLVLSDALNEFMITLFNNSSIAKSRLAELERGGFDASGHIPDRHLV